MKKYFYKILMLSLTLPVALTAVLCCRISGTSVAQASLSPSTAKKNQETMPACHAHARNKGKASLPAQGHCSCCIQQLQADLLTKFSFTIKPSLTAFVFSDSRPHERLVLKSKFNLSYLDGPPGPVADSPLYIHFRNLRI